MDPEIVGDLLDRRPLWSPTGDLHDIGTELLRIRLGHGVILSGPPDGQASSDVTSTRGSPFIRPIGKRYLGNTNEREVHDLHREQVKCQIDEIIHARHAVTFTPDTLAQATADGYDNCAHCIGSSTR